MTGGEREVLRAVAAAAERGEPLTFRELLSHDPEAVRALTEAGEIVEGRMRIGAAEIVIVLPVPPLPEDEDAWSPDEDAYLAVAYTAGVTFTTMAAALRRTGGQILQHAWALDLDRPQDRRPEGVRRRRGDDWTGSEIPAWRIARLRGLIEEAALRGANPRDDGRGLEHRALARHFAAARAANEVEARHYQPWSQAEESDLLRLRSEGLSVARIARSLGRTRSAIGTRLSELGVCQAHHWTDDEDRIVVAGIERGLTREAIAAMLPGRSALAVKSRAVKLVPGRGFDPWEPEEDAALRIAVANGENLRQFAAEIARTPGGVRWRARYLGLTHPGAVQIYTEAEDRRIVEGWKRQDPPREIAADLGRSVAGIYNRAFKLGVTGSYRRRITPGEVAIVRDRVAADATAETIAAEIGRTRHMVYRIAAQHGITWRRRGAPAGSPKAGRPPAQAQEAKAP